MTQAILSPDLLPRTIIEARHSGQAFYFTGRPCAKGHVDVRNARSGDCLSCAKSREAKWFTKYTNLSSSRWQKNNPDKVRQHAKNFRAKNPSYGPLKAAERRAAMLKAAPPWFDKESVCEIYRAAKLMQSEDGVKRHVDHIIPLKHELVCGLHVAENLRVVTATENMSKSNFFELCEHLCTNLHKKEVPDTVAS